MYQFRNLPANCVSDDKLWCVSGSYSDENGKMSGILEWCISEEDAIEIFQEMIKHEGFSGLVPEKYKKEEEKVDIFSTEIGVIDSGEIRWEKFPWNQNLSFTELCEVVAKYRLVRVYAFLYGKEEFLFEKKDF